MTPLRQRVTNLERQRPADGLDALARIADRLKADGQLPDDDPRDAGYQRPEGYDQMTIGERTLHALAWRYRDA